MKHPIYRADDHANANRILRPRRPCASYLKLDLNSTSCKNSSCRMRCTYCQQEMLAADVAAVNQNADTGGAHRSRTNCRAAYDRTPGGAPCNAGH